MEPGTSARQQVAQALGDTCICGELNDSYGVSCTKETDAKNRTYWSVTFCRARTVDGVIKVYSPNFIQVKWMTAYRDLPSRGQEVFRSEAAAKEFLIKNFVRP